MLHQPRTGAALVGDAADLVGRQAVPVHHVPAQRERHGELLAADAAGGLARVALHVFGQVAPVVVGGAAHRADLERHGTACGRRRGVSGRCCRQGLIWHLLCIISLIPCTFPIVNW